MSGLLYLLRIYASRESFTSSREREIDPLFILTGLNEEITSILFSTMLNADSLYLDNSWSYRIQTRLKILSSTSITHLFPAPTPSIRRKIVSSASLDPLTSTAFTKSHTTFQIPISRLPRNEQAFYTPSFG